MVEFDQWEIDRPFDSAEYLDGPSPGRIGATKMESFEREQMPCGCEVYKESRTPTIRCERAKQLGEDLLGELYDEEDRLKEELTKQAKRIDKLLIKHYAEEMTAVAVDRRMVKALGAMEKAMRILAELRKDSGDKGPALNKGEAELHKAYDIVSAKRPILEADRERAEAKV